MSTDNKKTIELHEDTILQILRSLDTRIEYCVQQQEINAQYTMNDIAAQWRVRELNAIGAVFDFKAALGMKA